MERVVGRAGEEERAGASVKEPRKSGSGEGAVVGAGEVERIGASEAKISGSGVT
jgi:hypothetical protein